MENKKVVIVCNGESVLQKKNGKLIDSFDRVIRLGKYTIKGYEDWVGSKDDIAIIRDWQTCKVSKDVEIWSPPVLLKNESLLSDKTLTNKEYFDVKNELGVEIPTTGIIAYFMAKKHLPGYNIYYTGLDFLKGGWYWKSDHKHFDFASEHNIAHEPLKEKIWVSKMQRRGDIQYV